MENSLKKAIGFSTVMIIISFLMGTIFSYKNHNKLTKLPPFKWIELNDIEDNVHPNELLIYIPEKYDKKEIYSNSSAMIIFDVIADRMITNVKSFSRNPPLNIKMYRYLNKYAAEYGVPINIAFGIAKYETGYMGLFHWSYNPKVTSTQQAHGAMQIRVPTANDYSDNKITEYDLLNDLELNVELSMKIISSLKDRHGSWELALGAYNTGKPKVNNYARNIYNFSRQKEFVIN